MLAAGTTNNFFGIPGLEKRVFTLKSTPEAIRCRNEVLERLERASLCRNDRLRRRMLTFVVVGGGPTGVEIAGALGEMKRFVIKREYPSINPEEMKVILVEGSERLLGAMSAKSGADALEALGQLMVDVRLGWLLRPRAYLCRRHVGRNGNRDMDGRDNRSAAACCRNRREARPGRALEGRRL